MLLLSLPAFVRMVFSVLKDRHKQLGNMCDLEAGARRWLAAAPVKERAGQGAGGNVCMEHELVALSQKEIENLFCSAERTRSQFTRFQDAVVHEIKCTIWQILQAT